MLCALLGHNKHCKYLNILGLTKTVAMCNKLQIDIGSLYETMLYNVCPATHCNEITYQLKFHLKIHKA